ncbi:MAG: oxidoreductase [Planctomycetaceae bacterium]|nr:oxidoreductase [Planctomycetaceae bacterium]
MTQESLFQFLGLCVVIGPALLLAVFGITALINRPLSERWMARLTEFTVVLSLLAAVIILIMMLAVGRREVPVELGHWVQIDEGAFSFHVHLKFIFDRLSVPFVILSFILCGTIGAFASRYLHREAGYTRFFVFYAVFLFGMVVSSVAGTIETLFIGWEFVGLSSALLVAFFHERRNPVRNGHRVWSVYRIADAAFLVAALTLHHLTGAGDFDALTGKGAWPVGQASIPEGAALLVGLLLLVAAAGKSALVPFSGWLPRAMEGPTPSSAVFYGSLSVHLGAFLLLRVGSIIEASLLLSIAVVALGLISAAFGAVAARVQTDVKTALAFASLTQVGIIVAEIGFGLRYIPLIHIIGHACLRTLQLLRAPSLLHDYHSLENAIGSHLPENGGFSRRFLPDSVRSWIYRFSLERGFLDAMLDSVFVRPFNLVFEKCNSMERRWTEFLSRDSNQNSSRSEQSLIREEVA